jgi:hypothetical protein
MSATVRDRSWWIPLVILLLWLALYGSCWIHASWTCDGHLVKGLFDNPVCVRAKP